jgi:hypothetical protein
MDILMPARKKISFGAVWADPDLEHAAESMRYLYENRNKAQQIGSRAKQAISQRCR